MQVVIAKMETVASTPRDFKERQLYYEHHPLYRHRQDSWMKCYDYIISTLKLAQPNTVVELGCNDGSLAVECLGNLPRYVQWIGYDIHKAFIDKSKQHQRYRPVLLEKQLWEYDLPTFDTFVSSHTIEHLYSDEVESLARWLSKRARFLVLCVPLRPDHGRLHADHILDKGSDWLVKLLEDCGFSLVWQIKGWFGWFKK